MANNKKIKFNDHFDDNELIYLFQSETNIKAKDILYDKYKNKLLAASMRYLHNYMSNLPLEMSDLLSINYSNFMIALQSYDVKNTKYDFASCLFTINRSELRKLLLYYYRNNESKTLTHCISLTADVESSSTYKKAIATDKDINNTENSITYDSVINSIKDLLSGKSFMIRLIYTMFSSGLDPVQIAAIFNLNIKKVYFIIKKINNLVKEKHKWY